MSRHVRALALVLPLAAALACGESGASPDASLQPSYDAQSSDAQAARDEQDAGPASDGAPPRAPTQSELAASLAKSREQDAGAAEPVSTQVTYQRQIRPLLEANCVECHSAGGIGPSRLDEWPMVKTLGRAIVAAVSEGRMPPWPASSSCREIADSRGLSSATKLLFSAWQSGGFLEGDAADYRAPAATRRVDLGPPSQTMSSAEPFTPAPNSDTYRCFFAGSVEIDSFLTALDIVPGARSQVHHVQLHRVAAADVAAVQASDARAEGGGYPCSSGGVGSVSSQNMFSYRPGALAVLLPPGDGVYLQAGSGLVLQIHYNTQFLPEGEPLLPDRTRVDLWKLPPGAVPARVIYRTGVLSPLGARGDGTLLPVFESSIAAGSRVISESALAMSKVSVIGSGTIGIGSADLRFLPGEIVGMTPHAHSWATRMVASIARSEQLDCLVDVPDWDYEWQLDYMFREGIPYGPEDQLHVQCDYDNSADNQPVINGRRQPVGTIKFGENTLDEMCLHYLWLRFDYAAFRAAAP